MSCIPSAFRQSLVVTFPHQPEPEYAPNRDKVHSPALSGQTGICPVNEKLKPGGPPETPISIDPQLPPGCTSLGLQSTISLPDGYVTIQPSPWKWNPGNGSGICTETW